MNKQLLLSILLCLSVGCLDNVQTKLAENMVADVKSEFVPDSRTGIFNIEVTQQGESLLLKGETNYPAAKELLLLKTKELNSAVIDSIRLLPADLGGKHYGVVRLSVANMRSAPKHSAELSTQTLLGSPLRVYKKKGDWYYVQTPDDYLGWLDKDGFTLMADTTYAAWMQAEKVIVTAESAKVYTAAIQDDRTVSELLPGNILQKTGTIGKFTQTRFPDGRTGYVLTANLADLPTWAANTVADTTGIFRTARRMTGSPYLWGGTSVKGTDCSGYTKQIFFENGILLPRDASQQVKVGELVEKDTTLSNLLPGDLLFFGRAATDKKKEAVRHVAIYLGDGKMIHSAGNVKIESLRRGDPDFAEDRFDTYLRAKRILGSEGKNGVIRVKDSPYYQREKE